MSSTSFHKEEWNSIQKFHSEVLLEEVSPSSSNFTSSSSSSTSPPSESSSTEDNSSYLETPLSLYETTEDYFYDVREDEEPLVAVVGVGYVGIHLVAAFSKCYKVIAFDVSDKRLAVVASELSDTTNIHFTTDTSLLAPATHFLVAVPTPLLPGTTEIDTSMIRSALDTICSQARRGATIVIESSVSVGMTRSLLGKMVQEYGLHAGMSPEVRGLPPKPTTKADISISVLTPAASTLHLRALLNSSRVWMTWRRTLSTASTSSTLESSQILFSSLLPKWPK